MGILIRIVALITGGKLVWLQNYDGRCHESIAYADAFGKTIAHRYWFTKIGHCILQDDGTVYKNSEASYIKAWKFA